MKNHKINIALLLGILIILIINHFLLNDWVKNAYTEGNAFINYFFPRFEVEKYRFDLTFFIDKKNQVIFRSILLLVFIRTYQLLPAFKVQKIKTLSLNIRLYFGVIAIFTIAWLRDIPSLVEFKTLYASVRILNLFQLPEPSYFFLTTLFLITIVSAILFIIKPSPFVALVSLLGFIGVQAIFSSYQKIDHGFTSFIYLGLVFCLFQFKKSEQQNSSTFALLMVSLCYFQAGLEKMLISQLEIFHFENIQIHLNNHPSFLGTQLLHFPTLAVILMLATVLFQLSFPVILFFPKTKNLYLILGIVFHLSIYFILGVGWWISPWSIALLLLVDWQILFSQLILAKSK